MIDNIKEMRTNNYSGCWLSENKSVGPCLFAKDPADKCCGVITFSDQHSIQRPVGLLLTGGLILSLDILLYPSAIPPFKTLVTISNTYKSY